MQAPGVPKVSTPAVRTGKDAIKPKWRKRGWECEFCVGMCIMRLQALTSEALSYMKPRTLGPF